jgi:hypothetical protein
MKVISDRVSIMRDEKLLSVVILPTVDKRKTGYLLLWLLAWTACGMLVMLNFSSFPTRDQKLFAFVYLAFWLYFEVSIARTWLWKLSGKEKLWIQKGQVFYQRELNGRGKVKKFDVELMKRFELIEEKPDSFSTVMNRSFWVRGAERVSFECQGKTIRLGLQLNDKEAGAIVKEANSFVAVH